MSRTKSAVALLLVAAINVQAFAQNPAPGRGNGPQPSSASLSPGTVPPGTPASAFGTIHVTALSATNSPLVHWTVGLRDARYGRRLAMNLTDEAGLFIFRDVDPGSYIIELIGGDQTIRATSALLAVEAGASVFAVVRLPTQPGVIAAFFGAVLGSAAALTMALAGTADVPAVQPTTPVSPR
jgi:hypothetical protein